MAGARRGVTAMRASRRAEDVTELIKPITSAEIYRATSLETRRLLSNATLIQAAIAEIPTLRADAKAVEMAWRLEASFFVGALAAEWEGWAMVARVAKLRQKAAEGAIAYRAAVRAAHGWGIVAEEALAMLERGATLETDAAVVRLPADVCERIRAFLHP